MYLGQLLVASVVVVAINIRTLDLIKVLFSET